MNPKNQKSLQNAFLTPGFRTMNVPSVDEVMRKEGEAALLWFEQVLART